MKLQLMFVIISEVLVEIVWPYVGTNMPFEGWQVKNVKEMSLYKNGLISFVLFETFEQTVLSKDIVSLWKINLL